MQDRYVGDIGDFVKYGLLIFLIDDTNLKLGINWYLNLTPNETGNQDGKYTGYLQPKRFSNSLQQYNPKLYQQLHEIVFTKKRRSISEIEGGRILPKGTLFFSDSINYDRDSWHLAALKKLERADIVFLDPDTGIQTKRMTEARKKSPEYVLWREIAGYYERGQSVIVYSRRSRQEESIYRSRFDEVKKLIDKLATTHILRAPRFTTRDFLMLIQPKHTRLMDHKIKNFMESDWKEHFSQLE